MPLSSPQMPFSLVSITFAGIVLLQCDQFCQVVFALALCSSNVAAYATSDDLKKQTGVPTTENVLVVGTTSLFDI